MKESSFEEKIETFNELQQTKAMSDPPPHIKSRLDKLRGILIHHPLPTDSCAFLWVKGRGEKHWFPLHQSVTIGASNHNDLVVDDDYVSGQHCRIEQCDGHWNLTDLDSKNGVFVNGNRLLNHRLQDGDIIQLGNCSLLFVTQNEGD